MAESGVHWARSCCFKSGDIASSVRRVAPACLANSSFARRPMRCRSSGWLNNERNCVPRFSAATVFTASALFKEADDLAEIESLGPTRIAAPYCAGSRILWPPVEPGCRRQKRYSPVHKPRQVHQRYPTGKCRYGSVAAIATACGAEGQSLADEIKAATFSKRSGCRGPGSYGRGGTAAGPL